MEKKYIIVSPYRSGLGNVLMSLEIIYAMAYITGRTLIIPPSIYSLFLNSGYSKEGYPNYWDIFDYGCVSSEFDIIDYNDFCNFSEIKGELSGYNWFDNLYKFSDSIFSEIKFPELFNGDLFGNSNICFINGVERYENDEDFKNFLCNRHIIDLNRDEKYMYFDNTLFQNFFYYVYPGDKNFRNEMKRKVTKAVSYKKEFYDIANSKIGNIKSPFNAVHLRRNDFFIQYKHALESIESSDKFLNVCESLFDKKLPLYISSDEFNRDFFNPVKDVFNVYFVEDLFENLTPLEKTIVEQIICSKAENFIGTYPSTYTNRINVMRKASNKKISKYLGINELNNCEEIISPLPWTKTSSKIWPWNMPAYPQSIYE